MAIGCNHNARGKIAMPHIGTCTLMSALRHKGRSNMCCVLKRTRYPSGYLAAIETGFCNISYFARAAPSALQAAIASSSGASLAMTKSHAITAPSFLQRSSQLRIHSPSPQP